MSASGLVAIATRRSSRLTNTSSVAAFRRSVFSMPCAQNPQTSPFTVSSMVAAPALLAARTASSAAAIRCKIMMGSSKVEHEHGLELAVLRRACFEPGIALEQPQQGCVFGAAIQSARVLTCLDHEPDGERLVIVFVRRDAELQRVDAMAVRACLMQVGPQRCIDASSLVVDLPADVPGELVVARLTDVRPAEAAPYEDVALSVLEIPALRQVVRTQVSDVTSRAVDCAVERQMTGAERVTKRRSVERLHFCHRAGAVFAHHSRALRERNGLRLCSDGHCTSCERRGRLRDARDHERHGYLLSVLTRVGTPATNRSGDRRWIQWQVTGTRLPVKSSRLVRLRKGRRHVEGLLGRSDGCRA